LLSMAVVRSQAATWPAAGDTAPTHGSLATRRDTRLVERSLLLGGVPASRSLTSGLASGAMTSDAQSGILEGIRVIDLSDGMAGPVATLLLAESGADVVMVEPPDGAPSRALAGFRTWNRSKRSVVLDVDTADDRAALDQLLAAADVVVHNFGPTRARELALD